MHTAEAWEGDKLVGGSFGVSIGRVFTGESMFHRAPNAGKAQFAHLAKHLAARGYWWFDIQQDSKHLARFGAREISLAAYRESMAHGLVSPARFNRDDELETSVGLESGSATHRKG